MVNKIKKNELCPCGSEKKYKNCCMNKKERIQSITTKHEVPVKLTNIKFMPDGSLKMYSDNEELKPENVTIETLYKRDNGKDKILNQILSEDSKITTNPFEFIRKFDVIFGIDTNTAIVNGERLSVSSRLCIIKTSESDFKITFNGPHSWKIVHFKKTNQKDEEKMAIAILINHILEQNYNKAYRIGIVTDHDLGNLRKYNEREIPIFDNVYLPENFTLIYASSDVGNENILNKLIRACDKEAAMFLTNVENGKIKL